MSAADVELPPSAHESVVGQNPGSTETSSTSDPRSSQEQKQDAELAKRLSSIIEDANRRVVPLCKMIRQVSQQLHANRSL